MAQRPLKCYGSSEKYIANRQGAKVTKNNGLTRKEKSWRSWRLGGSTGHIGISYLYPALSISITALACSLPASETLTVSCLNSPQEDASGLGFTFGLAGNSIFESANRFCALSDDSHSKSFIAASG